MPRGSLQDADLVGVGLGVTASRARLVTDEMFLVAAKALAAEVNEADIAVGRVYPPLSDVRRVSLAIACAVAEEAYAKGLAEAPRPKDLRAHVASMMYEPRYEPAR